MRMGKATSGVPWWLYVESRHGWNAPNITSLLVSVALLVVYAIGKDVPRGAFFIPLVCVLLLLGVVLGPPLWNWRRGRNVALRQRRYLEREWSGFQKLVVTFTSFFTSDGTSTPYAIGVQNYGKAPQFTEHMNFLNTFTDCVERAARVTPRTVDEARQLAHGLESAFSFFEGRGSLTALRELELAGSMAESRGKFFDAYNRFKIRYEDYADKANDALGGHVFGKPWL